MKKITIYIYAVVFSLVIATSCQKAREITYTGPSVVEFKNHILGRNAAYTPVGVYTNASGTPMTLSSRYVSVDRRVTDSVLVQLVGPHSNTDITIEYKVGTMEVPASQQSVLFPAVEGTHFQFASPNKTVTIPANSSSGWILINPIAGSAEAGKRYFLVLELVGNSQILASENYKRFTTYYRD